MLGPVLNRVKYCSTLILFDSVALITVYVESAEPLPKFLLSVPSEKWRRLGDG